jgi:hypothetical protein
MDVMKERILSGHAQAPDEVRIPGYLSREEARAGIGFTNEPKGNPYHAEFVKSLPMAQPVNPPVVHPQGPVELGPINRQQRFELKPGIGTKLSSPLGNDNVTKSISVPGVQNRPSVPSLSLRGGASGLSLGLKLGDLLVETATGVAERGNGVLGAIIRTELILDEVKFKRAQDELLTQLEKSLDEETDNQIALLHNRQARLLMPGILEWTDP